MSAIPGNLDTGQQPPMTVPLRHFLVALAFLLTGALSGIAAVADLLPGFDRLIHVHLLLAGWVCLTIMGAMTQFVPVWSGTNLHSRRLATAQLALVTVGLTGFALALGLAQLTWLVVFGAVMLVGFWVFVYNVARTLATVERFDVTERHFLFALGCFLLLTSLGVALAVNLATGFLSGTPLSHGGVLGAHVTLAVFGAVLTTIYGALYQLGTMFTQTELHGVDHHLQTVEEGGHVVGVVLLATGRLLDAGAVARAGSILVLLAALAFAAVVGRKLVEMQVEWTPMHSRYTVVVSALAAWAVFSGPAWLEAPTAREHLLGASGTTHLLLLGVVGFVIFGTLYHVVPFIVWIHQYSDRLGFEDVPMIDDLYDDKVAAADFALLITGTALLVFDEAVVEDARLTGAGGILVTVGIVVFLANMLLVIRTHGPHSLPRVVFGSLLPERQGAEQSDAAEPRS